MLHVDINTIPTALRLTILFSFGTNVDFVIGTYDGYDFFVFVFAEFDKDVCYSFIRTLSHYG
jgi:hypothetical protein